MEFYQELLFTAILSVLLAFLLGKLFSIGDDDEADHQLEPTKIAGERQGNDSLQSDQISSAEVRSDPEMKCEEKGFGVDGVRSGVSAREITDEVEIERIGEDLVKEVEISEVSEVRVEEESRTIEKSGSFLVKEEEGLREARLGEVDDVENRFEVSVVGDNSAREMPELKESQCLEEAKEIIMGLEREVDAVRIETEVKAERADKFLVEENECGEDVAGSREEGTVLKEGSEGNKSENDEKGRSLLSEEDEWEGIERTELEKHFHEAAAYVGSEGGEFALSSLSDDEQMQLYGLHKVATEGPCYDPQPMALKVSGRARWHAWQKLGNMDPDVAMEQYMSLLSEKIPGWMGEKPEGDVDKHEQSEGTEAALSGTCTPDSCLNIQSQLSIETERREECPSCVNEESESASAGHTGQGFMRTA